MFNSVVPGGWSIAVEITFYAIFPFLSVLLRSYKRCLVALLAYAPVAWLIGRYLCGWLQAKFWPGVSQADSAFFFQLWFPKQILVFGLGILVFRILTEPSFTEILRRPAIHWSIFALSFLLLFVTLVFGTAAAHHDLLVFLSLAGCVTAISAGACPFVVNPAFCYLGKISYSCYLVHFAVQPLAMRILNICLSEAHPFIEAGGNWSNLFAFVQLFAVTLCLTIPVATLTLHLIEKPGIQLGRKLIRAVAREANHHQPSPISS